MRPDFGVILYLQDNAERQRRLAQRGELSTPDTFESKGEEFQERVNDGYCRIARDHQLAYVSANQSPAHLSDQIYSLLALEFPEELQQS